MPSIINEKPTDQATAIFKRQPPPSNQSGQKKIPMYVESEEWIIEDASRGPLFKSGWRRSIPYMDTGFAYDIYDEPHRKRRMSILAKYPQVTQLFGHDTGTKWYATWMVAVQMFCCKMAPRMPWWLFLLTAYVIGGTATNMAGVIIHDAGHNLVDARPWVNKLWCMVANVVIPVPMAMSFRRYHFEHHTYQGVKGMDPDLPMDWELALIKGNTLLKVLWLMIYPAMYVIRGAAFGKTPSRLEILNWVFTLCSNALVFAWSGWIGLAYLAVSLWLGFSFHPAAMHFIQEHYTWEDGQETYSYYGWMNTLFLNIGYHNEHHDFPQVAHIG